MKLVNRFRRKKKLNNGGYSLIEVLVTVMILGIISVPLITTFVNAARVNAKSRKIQNATDAAQNMAEELSSVTLSEFESKYCPNKTFFSKTNDAGVEEFRAYSYDFASSIVGAEGEDFTAKVTMTPQSQYIVPKLHSFFGDAEIVCVREVGRYDHSATMELGGDASAVSKSSTINIMTQKDGTYQYSIDIVYTAGSDSVNKHLMLKEGTIADEKGVIADGSVFPTLYIVYDGFKIAGEECLDTININYSNNSNTEISPVTVYFLPQNEENATTKVTKFHNLGLTYTSPGYIYDKNSTLNKINFIEYNEANKETLVRGDAKVTTYEISISILYKSESIADVKKVCDIFE